MSVNEFKKLKTLFEDPESGLRGKANLIRLAKQNKINLTQKQISEWFAAQKTSQIFKRTPTRKIPYIPIQCSNNTVGGCLQADLIELPQYMRGANSNTKYILTIIDITSKFAWAFALKNKQAATVAPHIAQVIKEVKKTYPNIQNLALTTDDGSEFKGAVNSLAASEGVSRYSSVFKNNTAVVERFNQTLWNYFRNWSEINNSLSFVKHLHLFIKNYNNSFHTSIKGNPIDIFVKKTLKPPPLRQVPHSNISIGNTVRLQKEVTGFEKKSFRQRFSKDVYTVVGYEKNRYSVAKSDTPLKRLFLARELMNVEPPKKDADELEQLAQQQSFSSRVAAATRKAKTTRRNKQEPAFKLDTGERARLQPKKAKRNAKKPAKFQDGRGIKFLV